MTSKRHYLSKHNSLLRHIDNNIKRGDNVPDNLLNKEQLDFRKLLYSYRLRIDNKIKYGEIRKKNKIKERLIRLAILYTTN